MPTDTTATLHLTMDRRSAYAPTNVVMHLPWFVDAKTATATANGKPLDVKGGAVAIPAGVDRVDLTWHRVALPEGYPNSYTTAVEQYEREYRERFEKLTGTTVPVN